ncbi:MAG: tetratricopeptide repeat protein [Alistipes finegoldii]
MRAQALANGADEQVAILTAASKKFNDARVWNNLGVAQTQAGDKAAALKSFEKAAKLDSSKELNKNLLLANLANNNTAEAKKYAAPPTLRLRLPWLLPGVTQGCRQGSQGLQRGYRPGSVERPGRCQEGYRQGQLGRRRLPARRDRHEEGDLKTAEAQLKSAVSKNPALAQKAAKDINLKPLQK